MGDAGARAAHLAFEHRQDAPGLRGIAGAQVRLDQVRSPGHEGRLPHAAAFGPVGRGLEMPDGGGRRPGLAELEETEGGVA